MRREQYTGLDKIIKQHKVVFIVGHISNKTPSENLALQWEKAFNIN
jgi:hypothetical protein